MVPPSSHRVPRVRRYSGSPLLRFVFGYAALTLCRQPSQTVLLTNSSRHVGPNPCNIATTGLASSDFARHYFRNHCCFLFLRVLRCFSSPSSPPRTYFVRYGIARCYSYGVPSFGYLRVLGYLLLSATFRSLSRPSSAPCTKASSVSPL